MSQTDDWIILGNEWLWEFFIRLEVIQANASILDKEAFRPLADPIFASALYNVGYFVEWKNYVVDLSEDMLWHISTKEII